MTRYRVVLADDHAQFREALRMMLEDEPWIEVVAEVVDGPAVLAAVAAARVDVVCMDINMPGMDGIETTRRLRASAPDVKVVGLSNHLDPSIVAAIIAAGAHGYVSKLQAGDDLPAAIRAVTRDQAYLSPELGISDVTELMRYLPRGSPPAR